MTEYEKLKRALAAKRSWACEALEFWPHACAGGLEAHHVLFTRRHAQGSRALRKYADDPMNLALVCSRAHDHLGHSKAFRIWWRDVKQPARYGADCVKQYVGGWPGRVKV